MVLAGFPNSTTALLDAVLCQGEGRGEAPSPLGRSEGLKISEWVCGLPVRLQKGHEGHLLLSHSDSFLLVFMTCIA